jgi:hypothetical protein
MLFAKSFWIILMTSPISRTSSRTESVTVADQIGRDFHLVLLLKEALDLSHRRALGVHGDNLLIKTTKASLLLWRVLLEFRFQPKHAFLGDADETTARPMLDEAVGEASVVLLVHCSPMPPSPPRSAWRARENKNKLAKR